MIKFLLDTNVISEAVKKAPDKHVMNKLRRHQDEIATASLVWHELQFGCKRLPICAKRKLIESFLSDVVGRTIPIMPYDDAAALWHAEQRTRLTDTGKPPSFIDGQIAAIAAINGLTLVTRNVSDYICFSKLIVQNWHEAD